MIYLLLGKDDFSKKEFLQKNSSGLDILSFDTSEELNADRIFETYISGDLFGGKKLIKLEGALGDASFAENFFNRLDKEAKQSKDSQNILAFVEESLDKRKKETKAMLTNKNLKVIEFEIPSEDAFKKWVIERAKTYEIKFGKGVLELFLSRLGLGVGEFGKELYSLWQADNELKKIKAFAGDDEVSQADVANLVSENIDDNVFAITRAIGERNQKQAVQALTSYFDKLPGTDEKTKVISLSGLLAEQFRSMLIIKSLDGEGRSEAEISKATGFTPNRIYMIKKTSRQLDEKRVLDALKKLEFLDEDVKTSAAPAGLQFMMIIRALLV